MDAARVRADLTTEALWLRYVALTGTGDLLDVDGFLQGVTALDGGQEVVLAQALNEAMEEEYRTHLIPVPPPGPVVASAWPAMRP